MADLKLKINNFEYEFTSALQSAYDEPSLEQVRITYLSRQGQLTTLMSSVKELSPEEKRIYGPLLNKLKEASLEAFETKKQQLTQQQLAQQEQKKVQFDVTAYQPGQLFGSLHPYTLMIEKIEDIFISMGYEVVDGPEVETDKYNFEALNIPPNHPARDMWDTFWLDIPDLLLRTHTSSVAPHIMLQKKLPLAIIAPGRCYRHEATDASHDFMFMQCEGLFIDQNISLNNLLATVKTFLQAIFEKTSLEIRTRPSYFPFVEPGVEIDVSCPFCTYGCSVCKKSGWIEICGAGLTHPNVLSFCGIDPHKYTGFAFGFGLSRLVMLKYGINDIRLLHSSNIDFLKQF